MLFAFLGTQRKKISMLAIARYILRPPHKLCCNSTTVTERQIDGRTDGRLAVAVHVSMVLVGLSLFWWKPRDRRPVLLMFWNLTGVPRSGACNRAGVWLRKLRISSYAIIRTGLHVRYVEVAESIALSDKIFVGENSIWHLLRPNCTC